MQALDAANDFDYFRIYSVHDIGMVIQGNGSTSNVYIGGICGATPTYGTTGTPLTIKIGVKYL